MYSKKRKEMERNMNQEEKNRERAEILKGMIEELHQGKSTEEVSKEFKEKLGSISAAELAAAEQEALSGGVKVSEVQTLCDAHAKAFASGISSSTILLDMYHQKYGSSKVTPNQIIRTENLGIRSLSKRIRHDINDEEKRYEERLRSDLALLMKVDVHYSKKENLYFPFMTRRGIASPVKVMWGVDDDIREEIKNILRNLKTGKNPYELKEEINKAVNDVDGMCDKEDKILIPMVSEKFRNSDWNRISEEMPDFEYVFLSKVPSPADYSKLPEDEKKEETKEEPEQEEGYITLPTGRLTREELIGILNVLPVELTYVDKNRSFTYFNEPEDKVFVRTKASLNENAEACHPAKVVPMMEMVFKQLESGAENKVEMVFPKNGELIYNQYLAVRNSRKEYLGCLEVTMRLTHVLSLLNNPRLQGFINLGKLNK